VKLTLITKLNKLKLQIGLTNRVAESEVFGKRKTRHSKIFA